MGAYLMALRLLWHRQLLKRSTKVLPINAEAEGFTIKNMGTRIEHQTDFEKGLDLDSSLQNITALFTHNLWNATLRVHWERLRFVVLRTQLL